MIKVLEITIIEFTEKIYDKYIKLFPKEEQRNWKNIINTYKKGIEKFYKIVLDNNIIGFFMLEKINDEYPFYLDYFAIFEEYQNMGYGTKAIRELLKEIIIDKGLIAEIEKEDASNKITTRRFNFYKKLGFKKIESEYLLFNVIYEPIVNFKDKKIDKKKIDSIFFDYYKTNSGEEAIKNKCKIIK